MSMKAGDMWARERAEGMLKESGAKLAALHALEKSGQKIVRLGTKNSGA
jgi:hypothetical protein